MRDSYIRLASNPFCHSYTPSLIQTWFAHGMMTTRLPELSDQERELCSLATLSVIDSPYPRFAHKIIAGEVGLAPSAIQAAMKGTPHSTLSETEAAVYRLARVLAESRGPIADHDFQTALSHLDRKKILAVVHMVVSYIYVSLLTNTGDGEVPTESGAENRVQE